MCKKIRSSGCSSNIIFVTTKVNVKRVVASAAAASIVFVIDGDDTELEVEESTNLQSMASGENRAVG